MVNASYYVIIVLGLAGIVFIGVSAFIFWAAMLLECADKEPTMGNDRLLWLIVILFLQLPGAVFYFFYRRPWRIAHYGK